MSDQQEAMCGECGAPVKRPWHLEGKEPWRFDPTAFLRERVERLTQQQCCDLMYAEPDGAKRKDGSE